MTTFFPFIPTTIPPAPSFQPTLDNNVYTVTVNANLFGQRYYLLCVDQFGNVVFNEPMVETGPSSPISTLNWNAASFTATVAMLFPHGYPVGSSANLTIEGANPVNWNGTYYMLAIDPFTFTFPLTVFPGNMIVAGVLSYLVSISMGWFNSTLVFRNNQFEINP
jgi:hypothetical protein